MTSKPPVNVPLSVLRARLTAEAGLLAERLLGRPTRRSGGELRWGSKGSFCVTILGAHRGRFADFEAGVHGDALDLVQYVRKCCLGEAIKWARSYLGEPAAAQAVHAGIHHSVADNAATRSQRAEMVWREAVPIDGSPAQHYLARRGIAESSSVQDLRFHPSCPIGNERLPALVALFRDIRSNSPCGIHRTFITADGTKHPHCVGPKMMLGRTKFAAIKLCDDAEVTHGLGLAEGIENALTLIELRWKPVWAVGSAGAMKAFPVLPGIEHLTLFADADDRGVGVGAARHCAARWAEQGRPSTIHIPPAGKDWNDLLRAGTKA